MQHWVCLQAEQALDAELAIHVQDDGASPMEADILPEAACLGTLPADDRADHTVIVVSEASTKGGHKRKQQHSSTHKLPRCVLDGSWPARLLLLHLHWPPSSSQKCCKVQTAQYSFRTAWNCCLIVIIHTVVSMIRDTCVQGKRKTYQKED